MPRASRRTTQSVTIQTVAQHAGVSTMTVSNVLNNRRNVSDATRQSVLEAVRELGYTPNQAARSLASAATVRIGLICGKVESGYLSSVFSGIIEEVSNLGVQLVMRRFERPSLEPIVAAVHDMARLGVGAIVAHPPYCELLAACGDRLPLPLVAISPGEELPRIAAVRIDDRAAAHEMTRYLATLGHRRIGFVRLGSGLLADQSRFDGYRAALAEAGIPFEPDLIEQGSISFASGISAAERLLEREPRPTAVFASSDELAVAAITVAHRKGLDVPGELSICGFDDGPLAQKVWPALTTVHQPVATLAALAARRAVDLVRNEGSAERERLTDYEDFSLVVRESTGPVPSGGHPGQEPHPQP